jgi:hypothetical protein
MTANNSSMIYDSKKLCNLFLSKLWSELKFTKKPTKTKFQIDIYTFDEAKIWVSIFDPKTTFICPPPTTQPTTHITKTKIWRKKFLAAHYLESSLGIEFHCCDGGNQFSHFYIHSGIERISLNPFSLKLEFHEVSSFIWLLNSQIINQNSLKIYLRFILICSFTTKVSKIDNNDLSSLYAVASSRYFCNIQNN